MRFVGSNLTMARAIWRRSATVALVMTVVSTLLVAAPAYSGENSGLCHGAPADRSRGEVPAAFPVEACFDGSVLRVRNSSKSGLLLNTDGMRVSLVPGLSGLGSADQINYLTQKYFTGDRRGFIVMRPGEEVQIDIDPSRDVTVQIDGNSSVDWVTFLLQKIVSLIPGAAVIDGWDAAVDFINALSETSANFERCIASPGAFHRTSCWLKLTGAVPVIVAKFIAKIAVAVATEIAPQIQFVRIFIDIAAHSKDVVADALAFKNAPPIGISRRLPTATSTSSASAATTSPGSTPGPGPSGGHLNVSVSPEFLCDGGLRQFGKLTGASAGETVHFKSSPSYVLKDGKADGSGQRTLFWQCNPGESGTVTLDARGSASGRTGSATFRMVSPASAPPTTTSTTSVVTSTPTSTTTVPSSTSTTMPPQEERRVVVTISNLVTNGSQMREDPYGPVVLQTETRPYCGSACQIRGTERSSGQTYDAAVCQTQGQRITNGNDADPADDHNPGRYESTLWLGVRLADGRFGYVNETWIQPSQRGGLGLRGC